MYGKMSFIAISCIFIHILKSDKITLKAYIYWIFCYI